MDANTFSDRDAVEHIKLLRKASRTRLILLGLWVVLTWGLWAALQAGDQRTLPVDETYDGRLVELKKKWNILPEISFGLSSDDSEVMAAILKENINRFKNIMEGVRFDQELDATRNEYYAELERAYIVHIKVPYLQENVEVNGLTLADWWPFGLIAIVAGAWVLSMRERTNAIVVAWISYNQKERPIKKDLVIQSDFLVGTVSEGSSPDEKYLVYRKPVMVQPESLILYALIGATIYMSLTFGFFQNPANSHEMESMFDYSGAIWFCIVALGILVWLTRKRYVERLEKYTKIRIRGRMSEGLERVAGGRWRRAQGALDSNRWFRKVSPMADSLFAVAALLCLYFPWMSPNRVPGYRFFLSNAPAPLDADLYFELQVQLYIAILFIILCLVDWLTRTKLQAKWYGNLSRVRRILGFLTAVLLGNLVFHFTMLQVTVMAQSERAWLLPPVNFLARPHPVKNSYLVWTDPSYGFWVFLILCLILVWTGKQTSGRTEKASVTPGAPP
jgi:hypothetical protein